MPKCFSLRAFLAGCLMAGILIMSPTPGRAQVNPGPHEILAFQDGFIVEAYYDLLIGTNNGIADWSGWYSTNWVSPNAYDGHEGTDIAVQTGTPLYATAAGQVTQVYTNFLRNAGTGYGNYVRIAVDGTSPNGEALDVIYMHMWTVS